MIMREPIFIESPNQQFVYFERNGKLRKLSEKQYYRIPDYNVDLSIKELHKWLKDGFIPSYRDFLEIHDDVLNKTLNRFNMKDFIGRRYEIYQLFWWICSIPGLPFLKTDPDSYKTFKDKKHIRDKPWVEKYFIFHTGYEPPVYPGMNADGAFLPQNINKLCYIDDIMRKGGYNDIVKYSTGEYLPSVIEIAGFVYLQSS